MRFRKGSTSLIVLVLAGGLLAACSRDPQVLKKKHFDRAQAYFQQGKYPEAALEYQNAIQFDSKYVEAHYQLAQTYLKEADWVHAYQQLMATVTLNPENVPAQIDLANLFLAAGMVSDARDRA